MLNLTQPAISAQIRTLEQSLGESLFERRGRSLILTDTGRFVYRYADEIFTLGRELQETLAGRPSGRPTRLAVGVVEALPKLVAFRLLEPALRGPDAARLVLREDRLERLLGDLAVHALDIVLADTPLLGSTRVRAFSHLLGECGVTVFGAPGVAAAHRRRFPESLDGAPFLVPTDNTALRQSLDVWFDRRGLKPTIVAEIEDSAVMQVFGQAGMGLFAAPTIVEREVRRQYAVKVVGRIPEVRERFYAISVERRIRNPAVLSITSAARHELFGGD